MKSTFTELYNKIINEQKNQSVVVSYARMNPITTGHKKLINKIISEAERVGGQPILFLSHTQNAKKDPLSLEQKIYFVKKAFPNITIGNNEFGGKFTPPEALEALHKVGYENVLFVVGDDRVKAFQFLKDYNGKPDRSGKLLYDFNNLDIISAGMRDPDAEGVEGMSATKMREAVVNDDYESFKMGSPFQDDEITQQMFKAVADGLNL